MENDIHISMDKEYANYTIHRITSKALPGANDCLIWQGAKNKAGYGLISITIDSKRVMASASRALYMAVHKVLLQRHQQVLPKCDNPSCVNIHHLFLGTAKDTHQNMIRNNRRAKSHKLHTRTRCHDNDILRLIKASTGPLKDIAEQYNVSVSYVSKLRNNKAKTLI